MSTDAITDEEFSALTNAILRRYDIDFTCYEPTSLKRRIARSISVLQLDSIHSLWAKMLKDPSFVYTFIDEISVGLTAMFRDPVLWRVLRREVLTSLHRKDQVEIWHAGCSTGEEVYTMGIVLQESGLLHKSRALATDISEAAIATALQGQYHELRMTEYAQNYAEYNPSGLFQRYHQPIGNGSQMRPWIIKHADFKLHNLITELPPRKFDIIFCRNVMIYFDQEPKVRMLKQFYEHLNEGGYLVIGLYDAMMPLIDKQKYRVANMEAKIFQKIAPSHEAVVA